MKKKPVVIDMKNRKGIGDIDAKEITDIDMSDLKKPMIAVFLWPDDDPEMCVARVYENGQPTNAVVRRKSLWNLTRHIEENTSLTRMERGADDDESLTCIFA